MLKPQPRVSDRQAEPETARDLFGGRLVSSLETMCHNGTLPSLRRVTSRKPKCSKLLLCTKTRGGHWSRVLGVLLGIKTLSTGSICFECGTWEKKDPPRGLLGYTAHFSGSLCEDIIINESDLFPDYSTTSDMDVCVCLHTSVHMCVMYLFCVLSCT